MMNKRQGAAGRWREIFRRQSRSGLSIAAFCRRLRIPQASFYAWRRRLRNGAIPSFAEVYVTSDQCLARGPSPTQRTLELVLHGGRSIVVRPGFDRTTLLALVDALERGALERGALERGVLERGALERGALECGILESGSTAGGTKAVVGVRRRRAVRCMNGGREAGA